MTKRLAASNLILTLLFSFSLQAQDENAGDKLFSFPEKLLTGIQTKSQHLNEQLDKQTERYLQKLARKEAKLQKRLYKIDPAAANNLFKTSQSDYITLINKIKTDSGQNKIAASGEYMPYMDSLSGGLSFLKSNGLKSMGSDQQKIADAMSQVNQLQNKLQDAEQIKQFIRERKEQIKAALSRYTQLPDGLKNGFAEYNKQAYYYSQTVREYRDELNDPSKLELRALSLLNRLPAFQDFMKSHSELAGLFNLPGGYGDPAQSLVGLQTRDMVSQQIMNQIGGPNAVQTFQQDVQVAQSGLNQFKDKLTKLGGGSGDIDMPNFKPNTQKTKTFLKRLEYGTNTQSQKSSYYFPTTTDMALSVGYKINDKATAGIGASYKMGWGKDIQHIALSSQGIGLRSYADLKLKGSFYASGGFEYNYQKPFNSLQVINTLNEWQQSGLVGVSKIVSLKTKVFKKTKLQLLWDFLSYRQRPVAQPIKFRVGYSF